MVKKIEVFVDGARRAEIAWDGALEGVMPDDIRLARKLQAIEELWWELVEKRVVRVGFDGSRLSVITREGGKVLSSEFFQIAKTAKDAGSRALEQDHPYMDICDFPGSPR